MKIGARKVKGLQIVSKGGARSSEAQGQASDVPSAPLNIVCSTYLTVAETREYLRLSTDNAVYLWAMRHHIPKCRVGRLIRFLRRDLDEAVQPQNRPALRAVHGRER